MANILWSFHCSLGSTRSRKSPYAENLRSLLDTQLQGKKLPAGLICNVRGSLYAEWEGGEVVASCLQRRLNELVGDVEVIYE